jgi:hypothetical protein
MSSWDRVGRANPLGQPINPTGVGGVGTMNGADQRPRHTNGTRPGTSNHRYRRRARSRRVSPCFRPTPSDWIVCQKKNGGLEQSANGRQQIRQRMADPKATDRRESEGDVMSDSGAWVDTRQWLDPRFSASTLHARPPHWPDIVGTRHRQGSACREGPHDCFPFWGIGRGERPCESRRQVVLANRVFFSVRARRLDARTAADR